MATTTEYLVTGMSCGHCEGAIRSEVSEALVGLGFSTKQADQTVEAVLANGGGDLDTSAVLRKALATLGPK